MSAIDRSGAAEFEDEDVVAAYVHRPGYPDALITRLLELTAPPRRVLDLGCGPGKLARALAPHVEQVIAVDPSAAMLRLAYRLSDGQPGEVRWTRARAEDLHLPVPLGLAVVGAAIHWMEPAALFPKLAAAMAPGAPLALVDGDAPTAAPWLEAYQAVIRGWVERLGGRWNDADHRARMSAHEPWFDVQGREAFVREVRQPLEDLIACEHSRATWARRRMGARANMFDADLRAALAPWAEDGEVVYAMETRLVWGWPRTAPSEAVTA